MAVNRGIEILERLTKVTGSVSDKLDSGYFYNMPKEIGNLNRALASGVLDRLVKAMNNLAASIKGGGGGGAATEAPTVESKRGGTKEPDASEHEYYSGRGGKLTNRLNAMFGRMNAGFAKFTSVMQQAQGSPTAALGNMMRGQGGLFGVGGAMAGGVGMLASSLTNPRPFSGAGQAIGGGIALAGAGVGLATGNPAIATAGVALGLLASAAMSAADKLKEYGDAKLNQMFKDAEFSPSMAMVQARLDMDRMMLSMERGERNAEAAQTLADAQINLERKMMPVESAWQRGTANVAAVGQGAAAGPIGLMGEGADKMFGTGGWTKEEQAGPQIAREMADARAERQAMDGRPARLGGPGRGGPF